MGDPIARRGVLAALLLGALCSCAAAVRGGREPEVVARAAAGVERLEAIPGGVLAESALDLWRVPDDAPATDGELRDVPGAELVVPGIGAWRRVPDSARVAWVDGPEVRTVDLADPASPRAFDVGAVAGQPLRVTPGADAAFLLEMSRPFSVDHEEVQPVLWDSGRAREASPAIRVREGLDVHWLPGAGRFALSSFEEGTVWTWAPGAAQPEAVFRADAADPLAETVAGPGDAAITLLLENEASGGFRLEVLPLSGSARPGEPVALPAGVFEACRWSPDGARLACLRTHERARRVAVLDRRGRLADEWRPPESEPLLSLAWAGDGRRLWLGTRSALRVWTPDGL